MADLKIMELSEAQLDSVSGGTGGPDASVIIAYCKKCGKQAVFTRTSREVGCNITWLKCENKDCTEAGVEKEVTEFSPVPV